MSLSESIESKLRASLSPDHLEIVNESHMHNVPPNSETHFKVVIVAAAFDGLRPVKRHQLVYQQLQEEFAGGLHALALHTYTPSEWQGRAPVSPQCLGGSKAAN